MYRTLKMPLNDKSTPFGHDEYKMRSLLHMGISKSE
jgi:hypothetical protein